MASVDTAVFILQTYVYLELLSLPLETGKGNTFNKENMKKSLEWVA